LNQKIFQTGSRSTILYFYFIINFFCIAGTIIEQDQSIEVYKINYSLTNPVFGFLTWDRILQFGLDHVYSTWWFFSLIFLFGLSLVSCTFLQHKSKIARRCQFFRTTGQFYRLKISTILNKFSFNKILTTIKTKRLFYFSTKNTVYCYKGLTGRIAPILVHFSMILVLLGTIIGSLFGFKAQESVAKSFHIQNILSNGQFNVVPKLAVRINDFWITYTKTKTVAQFYSDISVLNTQGNETEKKLFQ
jgi:cytochrome c biogenesis protein